MTTTRRLALLVAGPLLALGLAGCGPGVPRITTAGMYPGGFQTAVSDYVNKCDPTKPTEVLVDAPDGASVSVDGQDARSGQFRATVDQQVGESFTLVVLANSNTTTHHVRCLPADFPRWSAERTGEPEAEYYLTAPWNGLGAPAYPMLIDRHGVPVWWGPKAARFFTTLLPNGNVAWAVPGDSLEEHRLDGTLVRSFTTSSGPPDFHDLIVLPNGNHVMATFTVRPGGDFSSWGGPASASFIDHVLEEITPEGDVVWSWTTSQHIPVSETTGHWQAAELADPGGAFSNDFDPYHYNSVEYTGDGYIVSFRHLDAVYKINRATGLVEWKLGGSPRPESLAISGDPVFEPGGGGGFGGQHDARLRSDGTVSLYDNGSGKNRPPRGVAYQIDPVARTAVLVENVTDNRLKQSFCCGSARGMPAGDVVFGWGGNNSDAPDVSELTRTGSSRFHLWFPDHNVYRGLPVPAGVLTREALREGMDGQLPGGP